MERQRATDRVVVGPDPGHRSEPLAADQALVRVEDGERAVAGDAGRLQNG